MNVTPDDRDVWSPDAWAGKIHCSPPERAALAHAMDFGLVICSARGTATRRRTRGGTTAACRSSRTRGCASISSQPRSRSRHARRSCAIDRAARKGQDASDHAPVVAVIALSDDDQFSRRTVARTAANGGGVASAGRRASGGWSFGAELRRTSSRYACTQAVQRRSGRRDAAHEHQPRRGSTRRAPRCRGRRRTTRRRAFRPRRARRAPRRCMTPPTARGRGPRRAARV